MSSSASLIVVASNDPAVKKECQHQGAAAIDLYLDLQDTHTSKGGLQASAAAFTDFFVMLDSGGLVKAASSLSAVWQPVCSSAQLARLRCPQLQRGASLS